MELGDLSGFPIVQVSQVRTNFQSVVRFTGSSVKMATNGNGQILL